MRGKKLKLYNSFTLSHLNYHTTGWRFCSKRDSDKFEKLHERAFFQNKDKDYESLLMMTNRKTSKYCLTSL